MEEFFNLEATICRYAGSLEYLGSFISRVISAIDWYDPAEGVFVCP